MATDNKKPKTESNKNHLVPPLNRLRLTAPSSLNPERSATEKASSFPASWLTV